MRLLIVAETSSAHTPKWASAFAERGDDVLVVSKSADPLSELSTMAGTLSQLQFPPEQAWWSRLPRVRFGGGWQRWIAGYPAWRRIVHQFRPDITHVHFLTADVRNHFYYDSDRIGKLVVSSWGSDVVFDQPPPKTVRTRLAALLGKADRITATTRFLAEHTARFLPDANSEIDVIGFGVDTELFSPDPAPGRDQPLKIGWAKSLETIYGTELLADTLERLRRRFPSLELHLAGSGSQRDCLRSEFERRGLEAAVRFLGRLTPEGVARLLRDVDLFLMPSLGQESFGVAALEASAVAVPVVASDTGGIPEAVLDGVTGLLVRPGDVGALVEATTRLLEDPELRQRLGRAGREFVLERFPWQRSVDQMAAVYEDLL